MTNHTLNPDETFDAALTTALERAPKSAVPHDFAARVRAALPPQSAPRRSERTTRVAALAAAIVLTIALFLIAPHTSPSFASLNFDIELLVLAQLLAIACWLAARQGLGPNV